MAKAKARRPLGYAGLVYGAPAPGGRRAHRQRKAGMLRQREAEARVVAIGSLQSALAVSLPLH